MAYVLAAISLASCLAVALVIRWSSANPERSIWPPLRFGWRERIVTWSVTVIAIGAAYMAGRLGWNAWGWPDSIRWYAGFPLAFVSSSISSWAIVRLGLDQSMGANNRLLTTGPYALSRNPTYLANFALCAGWVLLAASWPALIAAGSLAALYAFAVPHEEKWLSRTYGAAFDRYCEGVKRWF
jgi:protein-S-isoprenylcysteine O-methyltransferase Ste14